MTDIAQLPVLARITHDCNDYIMDRIPISVSGQTYFVLSRSCTDPSDGNIVAGPAILEASLSARASGLGVCNGYDSFSASVRLPGRDFLPR